MIFIETKLPGAFIIELEKREDERGFFARAWCQKEVRAKGLNDSSVQVNISYNKTRGTLRGMHYQTAPSEEIKLVRCVRGIVYDVIIDLRPDSPTRGEWIGVELTADNYRTLYVPKNFAHGYQTLRDDSEVLYQVSEFYSPASERGVRYNDLAFAIEWPLPVSGISDKDRSWPDYILTKDSD